MYKCPACSKLKPFGSQIDLDQHIKRCHKSAAKGITYRCPLCSQEYSTSDACRQHRKTCLPREHHHDKGDSSISLPSTSSSVQGVPFSSPDVDNEDVEMPDDPPGNDAARNDQSSDNAVDDEDFDNDDDDDEDEGKVDSEEEDPLTVEEVLYIKASAFLTHIRDGCNATQVVIKEIVKQTDQMLDVFLEYVEKKLLQHAGSSEVISTNEMVESLRRLKGSSLFSGIQDLNDHLVQNGGMVTPERVEFTGSRQVLRNGVLVNVVNEFGYRIPFLKQLERFLQCEEILQSVDNPIQAEDGVYKTLLHGSFYKNSPIYQKDNKCLAVVSYADGLGLSDTASPRSTKNNVTNIYWTLANIPPELRSLDISINLLAIAKTQSLNSKRWDLLLADFVEGLKKLASQEGVVFTINGKQRVFHGMLLCCCGDTPAQAFVGGFKEAVSAEKPCRRCLACHADYLSITDIDQFTMRTAESHLEHLAAVASYKPPPGRIVRLANGEHPDPSIRFGVNRKSNLIDVPYFDVTRCLVQDPMHLGPEGLGEMLCRKLVVHVVKEKKAMNLDEVNNRIEMFSACFTRDKPSGNITDEHLGKKLRQSAAQMTNLCIILPFVLRTESEDGLWSFPGDDAYLSCFLEYLKVHNLSMAYELQNEDSEVLKKLMASLHQKLLDLFDKLRMAKIHFWHHLSELIELFGVLRQLACYRFEAHHAFFKRLIRILRSHKQVLLSLAVRHQSRQVERMMKPKFLYEGHQFGALKSLPPSVSDPHFSAFCHSSSLQISTLDEAKKLTMFGTVYDVDKTIIILKYTTLPEFGLLKRIYSVNNSGIVFICVKMKTVCYDASLNAFQVHLTPFRVALDAERLIFPHKIVSIKAEQNWYVMPYGHRQFSQVSEPSL